MVVRLSVLRSSTIKADKLFVANWIVRLLFQKLDLLIQSLALVLHANRRRYVFKQKLKPDTCKNCIEDKSLLHLLIFRCHKQLKLDKRVSKFFLHGKNLWYFYWEFGTKGIKVLLRHTGNKLCFKGTGLLDYVPFLWNDLLRAPSLDFVIEVYQKMRVYSLITPPVQAFKHHTC